MLYLQYAQSDFPAHFFPMTLTERKLWTTLFMLVPAAAVFLVYGDIVSHEFLHWDDTAYIIENDHIKSFDLQSLSWAFFDHYHNNWHPLTWVGYMIEYRLWGENAFLFKLVNIVIHTINSYLIILLTYKIINILYQTPLKSQSYAVQYRWMASLFAGTFFAIHPLHVESVAWISEFKDVLSGMFFFTAMIAYINHRQSGDDSHWKNLLALAFLCAVMSKSMAVTLPAILIVMDIFLFQRLTQANFLRKGLILIREKLLYFVISACVVLLTFMSQSPESLASTSLPSRFINACESLLLYLGNFLIPVNLSPFYPFTSTSLDPDFGSLIPVAILIFTITGLVLVNRFVLKGVVFALIFFIVTILPVLGLIKVGQQAAADRYTYIPLSMFFVVAGIGIFRCLEGFSWNSWKSGLGPGIATVLLGGYAWQTAVYVPIWKNDETLWSRVNTMHPMQFTTAYLNLGNVEYGKGNMEAALGYYEDVLAIDDNHIDALNALGNQAVIYEDLGHHDRAAKLYQTLAESNIDSVEALKIAASGLRRLGKFSFSARYYQLGLQLAPTSNLQLYESAYADHLTGDNDRAYQKVTSLLQLDSNHRQGRILNVVLLFSKGLSVEAKLELDLLREQFPGDPQIGQIDLQLKSQLAQ
jgi:tetratricopeptide (TPR) repeat protein